MFGILKNIFGNDAPIKEALTNGAVILDVRTPAEFRGGHVKGSINIPVTEIGRNIEKIKKYNKPVVACCASGMRSGTAAGMLKQAGIEAYNGGPWTSVQQMMVQ
ncbi:MAG TPA: rhodanese-like domain-containing protein [Flavilitoribacter sp.]|nr:rhodanese-like domain-containing protein [Flavilitoribacter sp.]HMQ86743.1 rhodanese-like domain-containing protein [Flavilitoribacter sp.]